MFEKIKFWLIAAIALLILLYILPLQNIVNYLKFEINRKDNLNINLTLINPAVRELSSDPRNRLYMRVEVLNEKGLPVPGARLSLSVTKNIGKIYPSSIRTDKNGESVVCYIPPEYQRELFKGHNINITLTAKINKTDISSSLNEVLMHNPIVFIPGYREDSGVFDNMKDYLSSMGYRCNAFDYDSSKGVISAADKLNEYLQHLIKQYYKAGFQAGNFTIISHSMGGLVARYFTTSKKYIVKHDVSKIVFVSVPHSGSPWASLGLKYYNDQGIKDLNPDSYLFQKSFPLAINKGLNRTIEIGNILGQFDEVVSTESASLDYWNIKTELFSVGENNLTMNNLFNGSLISAANHQIILSNKKVFERISEMLSSELPYPTSK